MFLMLGNTYKSLQSSLIRHFTTVFVVIYGNTTIKNDDSVGELQCQGDMLLNEQDRQITFSAQPMKSLD